MFESRNILQLVTDPLSYVVVSELTALNSKVAVATIVIFLLSALSALSALSVLVYVSFCGPFFWSL